MPHIELPQDGACRCGRVRLRITAAPLLTMACHYRGCQRMTASAFSLSVAVPIDGFAVIAGDTEPGGCHAAGQDHRHCGWCKSWLFTLIPLQFGFVNVRSTMFDDTSWSAPFVETCTCAALPWVTTGAAHSYAGFPAVEEYPRLIGAYAAS
ncbi:GFA family protein [Sphingomonas oligophenolica]|uniref:GFA family protein n=1 Tax=Sphingomonas oligophenolica TaxID=301154 RepID=A0A502CHA0_9SPHN|nr:GFA family protein [Sphingomonas oligophenolica]TPG13095.1 GFA family protein [Sphingomonas oligophenolica]